MNKFVEMLIWDNIAEELKPILVNTDHIASIKYEEYKVVNMEGDFLLFTIALMNRVERIVWIPLAAIEDYNENDWKDVDEERALLVFRKVCLGQE